MSSQRDESLEKPLLSKPVAWGMILILLLSHVVLTTMQLRERAIGAFLLECQLCLLGFWLVFGTLRIELRWLAVLLAYPYVYVLAAICDDHMLSGFVGKQGFVLSLAIILALMLRMLVLPLLRSSSEQRTFSIYALMISVTGLGIYFVLWEDDVRRLFSEYIPGRSTADVIGQTLAGTVAALSTAVPIFCTDEKMRPISFAVCFMFLLGSIEACSAVFVNFIPSDDPRRGICFVCAVWAALWFSINLLVMITACRALGFRLFQRGSPPARPE